GRPPIAYERKKFSLTIGQEEFDVLRSISDLSGSTPSALIRELLAESLPTLIDIRDSLIDAKAGAADRAFARLGNRLNKSINDADEALCLPKRNVTD
ncbi:MAG: hypothetical protein Q9M18_08745, partial [Mariprofundaceae bacterium]|nr:hypothetical protein [Mariprofundaceae bacterium]